MKKITAPTLALVIAFSLAMLTLAACSKNNAVQQTPGNLVKAFAASVSFDKDKSKLSFTIPEGLPPDCSFHILVAGRVKMGDDGMSIHLFAEESESNSWEAGKTYSHEFERDSLLEASILSGVQLNGDSAVLHEIEINIDESGNLNVVTE